MRLIEALVGRKQLADDRMPAGFRQPSFWSLGPSPLDDGKLWNGSEELTVPFEQYVAQGYRSNGIVFAVVLARLALFSEARFQWQDLAEGRPGDLETGPELDLLERPWPGATTGKMLARMELDVSIAGNSYWTVVDDRHGRRLRRLRPDWVTIVAGSEEDHGDALDARVVGYLYRPPGGDEVLLTADQVAHYAPIPDPLAHWRGMSWLTPVLREIDADTATTVHKGRFFKNGATPNMAVVLDQQVRPPDFAKFKAMFEEQHKGAENAYKTLFLGGGADVKPLTMDFRQLDFKMTQGAGETRIAAAGGVPPIIVGLSEGLQSATYSNYGQARRRFADGTMRPLWREAAGSLEPLVGPKPGKRLWYDGRDIAFLQEDRKDASEIQRQKASTIRQLVDAGYEPDAVVAAVEAENFSLLDGKHTGLYSVQLQPPGTTSGGGSGEPGPEDEDDPADDPAADPDDPNDDPTGGGE